MQFPHSDICAKMYDLVYQHALSFFSFCFTILFIVLDQTVTWNPKQPRISFWK